MGEVQGPGGGVAVDPRDGPLVALQHLADARLAARHAGGERGDTGDSSERPLTACPVAYGNTVMPVRPGAVS